MNATYMTSARPVVLSIAGSDSGGGAGIQADLRVFSRLGSFGTTVLTALTAQNLEGVSDVHPVPVAHIEAQLEAVLSGFDVVALKTGMLWSAACVDLVATRRQQSGVRYSVIDPVMVATSGARLLNDDALLAYQEKLLPGSTLITPNLDEAAVLLDSGPLGDDDLTAAAETLARRYDSAVLLKGGHLSGDPVDVLFAAGEATSWQHPRLATVNTHGSGCMLAAAITSCMSQNDTLVDACARSLNFVHQALVQAWHVGAGALGEVALAGIERASPEPDGGSARPGGRDE